MEYPTAIYDITTMIETNRDFLISEYGVVPEVIDQPGKVPVVVHVFSQLKGLADDLEGDILKIFAGCAYLCYKHGFGNLGPEAEALHYSTHARLITA